MDSQLAAVILTNNFCDTRLSGNALIHHQLGWYSGIFAGIEAGCLAGFLAQRQIRKSLRMVPSDRHVKELDGLRGIAVLLVLGWHFTGMLMNPADGPFQNAVWRFAIFGQSGVDLFFVLSGFLIIGILVDNRDTSTLVFFRTFYVRRALRIVPPYLLLVTAFASCTAIFGASYYLGRQLPLWSILTFTQNWIMADIGDMVARD
jgi:peptidoglycan/LPS O-acetylase OafA/YrhL